MHKLLVPPCFCAMVPNHKSLKCLRQVPFCSNLFPEYGEFVLDLHARAKARVPLLPVLRINTRIERVKLKNNNIFTLPTKVLQYEYL